jgi:hypothetical protein
MVDRSYDRRQISSYNFGVKYFVLYFQEEEHRLKKEFADLSIELNMEAQKHRIHKETDKEYTVLLFVVCL